jgi:hypothetical protein
MNKHIATLIGVGAVALLGSTAHAQTFNATPNTGSVTGSWNIVLAQAGGNWTVTIAANGGAQTPSSDVGSIGISFRRPFPVGTVIAANTASGTIVGGPAWSTVTVSPSNFQRMAAADSLMANGSNTFMATIALSEVPALNSTIRVTLNSVSSGSWFGARLLTPEAPAAAQLLPALLPVGLVLGRRRFLRKKAS